MVEPLLLDILLVPLVLGDFIDISSINLLDKLLLDYLI